MRPRRLLPNLSGKRGPAVRLLLGIGRAADLFAKRRNALLRPAPIVALVAVLSSAGCATYRPAVVEELAPDQRVRVRVEPEVLADLVAFAEGAQGQLGGRFTELRGDSAAFRFETPSSYRQVVLHRSAILGLERRETNPARSIAFSAAVVGGVGVLAWLGFEGRESGDDSLPPDTEALTPFFVFTAWPR